MNHSWPEVNAAVLAVLAKHWLSSRPADQVVTRDNSTFPGRLFSLRHAEAVDPHQNEIKVVAGTVVTPLANEYLKRRKIMLRFVSESEGVANHQHQGEWGFAIDGRTGQVEALRRGWLEGRVWREVGLDAVEAAHWVVDGKGRGAFVLAEEASVANWRASQVEGIRAATVVEPDAVSRAVRHLGANLIVAEPSGKSIFLLKQIGDRFHQGGAPQAPEGLR